MRHYAMVRPWLSGARCEIPVILLNQFLCKVFLKPLAQANTPLSVLTVQRYVVLHISVVVLFDYCLFLFCCRPCCRDI